MEFKGLLLLLLACVWKYGCARPIPQMDHLTLEGNGKFTNISSGFLVDLSGRRFDLSKLTPYYDLIGPELVQNLSTMSLYRATYNDGSFLLAEMYDNGTFAYMELSQKQERTKQLFIKTQECGPNELYGFGESQVRDMEFEGFSLDGEDPDENTFGMASKVSDVSAIFEATLPDHIYSTGDGSSNECNYLKVVKVGVVYDAEFCQKYGGNANAHNRIMLIVASASLFYEHDMCIKLQLTNIFTPDQNCEMPSVFATMPRDKACGGGASSETFIRYFADWMNTNREVIGFEADVVVHAFTGFQPRGVLGCAYIGTVCRTPEWAYGIDYMTSDFLVTQSVVFAHELGHNLNARHLSSSQSEGKRYIMNSSLQNPSDGFSILSVQRIVNYLNSDDVTCDDIEFPAVFSSQPSSSPSMLPSNVPSWIPSLSPTSLQIDACGLEVVAQDPICFTTSGNFGCVEMKDLIDIQRNPFCSFQKNLVVSRIEFQSCDELVEPIDRTGSNDVERQLRARNEEKSNDNLKASDIRVKGIDTGSNDQSIDLFHSVDCDRIRCTKIGSSICFDTNLTNNQVQRDYIVTFTTDVLEAKEMLLEVPVVVKQEEGCLRAESTCIDV